MNERDSLDKLPFDDLMVELIACGNGLSDFKASDVRAQLRELYDGVLQERNALYEYLSDSSMSVSLDDYIIASDKARKASEGDTDRVS